MHLCIVCSRDCLEHDRECYKRGCEDMEHWPPLCCPGCHCFSFEEAHGIMTPERQEFGGLLR